MRHQRNLQNVNKQETRQEKKTGKGMNGHSEFKTEKTREDNRTDNIAETTEKEMKMAKHLRMQKEKRGNLADKLKDRKTVIIEGLKDSPVKMSEDNKRESPKKT